MAETAISAPVESAYRLVDSIPEAYAARLSARKDAAAILESHRTETKSNEALLPVDALSTAHKVLECEPDSPEYAERYKGLTLDCQRLVGEWYRKLKPEYFSPTRHYFDDDVQEFFSHGLSVAQMTQNALVPLKDDHEEEARRINEYVEDRTPQILRNLGCVALGKESIRTISECPDTAIINLAEDQAKGIRGRGYWGYVPEIQKIMIRDIKLDESTQDRFQEQVAMPGTYFTHEIMQLALSRAGIDAYEKDKTNLHGSQILAKDDLLDFVKLLDEVASMEWCTNVFMGEEVPANFLKDYGNFRHEALQRQESLKDLAEIVTVFVLNMAEDNVDSRRALTLVEDFVKKQLLELGKQDVVAAEQMFDAETARGLQEVAYLESIGQYEAAFARMEEVEAAAPGGGYCGAGSCGLEGVNLSGESGKKLLDKLQASSGDKIVRDKERACKCGSKSVVYAYNKQKVTKYCENCSAFESKVSVVA